MKDLFAQASGPIVIGHHCDLTGVISSWGFWHDKAAKAAVDIINKGGGIAGRKVELVTEDTESNPAPGARKLRNLIQRSNAEFIVGSVHSGVMLAALPIATELKTIYFSTGEATEATGSKGTRFSFRTGTDTYSIAAASMPWAWRTSARSGRSFTPTTPGARAPTRNPKLFIEKRRRQGAHEHRGAARYQGLRALSRADSRRHRGPAAGLHRLAVGCLLHPGQEHGPRQEELKMFSSSASIESIAPDDIQGAAEGVYFFENFPRMLKAKDDEFHKEFNKLIGIDDVHAREIGGQRVMDKSHGWQAWEDIFALKQAIEKSGYKTRKDVEGVIQALEGMEMKNSLGHPQGDKLIRKEDHVGIIDCYISRVEGGKLEVKKRIPKEELAKNMPLRHDLSKMPA